MMYNLGYVTRANIIRRSLIWLKYPTFTYAALRGSSEVLFKRQNQCQLTLLQHSQELNIEAERIKVLYILHDGKKKMWFLSKLSLEIYLREAMKNYFTYAEVYSGKVTFLKTSFLCYGCAGFLLLCAGFL